MRETKMTRKEAEAEAVRRWGPLAYATVDWTAGLYDLTGNPRFYVGRHAMSAVPSLGLAAHHEIAGSGDSYEAAFADAVSPSGATHE